MTLRCYIELGTVMERGSDGEGRREEKQERRKKIEEVERWMGRNRERRKAGKERKGSKRGLETLGREIKLRYFQSQVG